MAVSAIQNDKSNSPRGGYISSIIAGSAVGFSLKYLIPLTPDEKDEEYKLALAKINQKNNLVEDSFLSISNKKELDNKVKRIRPTHIFVITGLVVGLVIAFTNNVRHIKAAEKAQKQNEKN